MRWWLALGVISSTVLATPSGRRWSLQACSPAMLCEASEQCTQGRCVPVFKIASAIDTGATSISARTASLAVPYTTVISNTQTIFDRWTTPNVTTCSTSWDSTYGGTFSSPIGRAAINGADRQNLIIWLTGSNWVLGGQTLGYTLTTYYTGNNQIIDADTEMNNNVAWANAGDGQSFDYESVVLHEAGHFLGLDHTAPPPTAVMNPNIAPGVVLRQLASSDSNDVCSVYSGMSGGQGTACTINTQGQSGCQTGLVCEGVRGTTGANVCTRDCTMAGQACPTGYTCQSSTNGFACLPRVGAPDLCAFCTGGGSCSSGLCLRDATGLTFCSMSCTSAAQCGPGYACSATALGSVCLPTNSCTSQCTAPAQCAPGYGCTGGTCVATGNVGDRCEFSEFCKNCGECFLTDEATGAANCRACCRGTSSATELCTSCPSTACDAGFACTSVSPMTQAAVCIPSQGTAACGACTIGSECSSGLCERGRCRSQCNPSNPGGCAACISGTPSSYCACSDEIVRLGEACGPMAAGGIKACLNELACVGSPQSVCRERCDPATPNSCPVGQTCERIAGQPVCRNLDPGTECQPCNGSMCAAGLRCVGGTCVRTCQTTQRTCTSCVPVDSSTNGVCACSAMLSGTGSACGVDPTLRGCLAGHTCFNGQCRPSCNLANPTCVNGQECQRAADGLTYCLDFSGGNGGGGGNETGGTSGSGGSRPGGSSGAGGGVGGPAPCGCSSAHASIGAFLLILRLRRRR
jgi:hypothetical protein